LDETGLRVCERVLNLARATTVDATVAVLRAGETATEAVALVLSVREDGTKPAVPGRPVVGFKPEDSLSSRLRTALESSRTDPAQVTLEVPRAYLGTEHEAQRVAVRLLDGVCSLFD
jgi:hypothetical protein